VAKDAKRLVDDASAAKSVETVVVPDVSVVNVGVSDTPMVEVEERTILFPAVKYDTGESKKEFQLVDDAVNGME
jgi:hypothetical protein